MDAGYVINLMSVDALKLSQTVRALHEVVTLPIYLALAAYFLYFNLQSWSDSENRWSSLIGMAVMVTFVPLITCIVAWKTKQIQVLQQHHRYHLYDLYYFRRRLATEGIVALGVTLCVCPPSFLYNVSTTCRQRRLSLCAVGDKCAKDIFGVGEFYKEFNKFQYTKIHIILAVK